MTEETTDVEGEPDSAGDPPPDEVTTDTETDPDTEVDDCGCTADEVCVTNRVVTNRCFSRDCPEESCGPDEVCYNDLCVNGACAGVDCDGEFMVCRGGVCIQGNCNDPDVSCSPGYDCVDDQCVKRCLDQSYCEGLACVEGYCLPCEDDFQCEEGTICVNEGCTEPCMDNPNMCSADQVCNVDTGRCIDRCETDTVCGVEEICDWDTGICVDEECTEPGESDECGENEVCVNRRCVERSPLFFGSFAAGGETSSSNRFILQSITAPMCIIGPPSQNDEYILFPGVITVLE